MQFKKKQIGVVAGAVLFAFVAVFGFNKVFNSPVKQAKKVVQAHLESIKLGTGNPYDYVAGNTQEKIFINVLDYKFLNVIQDMKVPKKKKIDFTKSSWSEYHRDKFDTYDQFIADKEETFNKPNYKISKKEDIILIDAKTGKITWDKDKYNMLLKDQLQLSYSDFVKESIRKGNEKMEKTYKLIIEYEEGEYSLVSLLYDVTITNRMGNKLYKKYKFILSDHNDSGKFKILRYHDN